jgi:hypothetical protein
MPHKSPRVTLTPTNQLKSGEQPGTLGFRQLGEPTDKLIDQPDRPLTAPPLRR